MARRILNGEGRRDGSSTARDARDGSSTARDGAKAAAMDSVMVNGR
jgi:hypothetical protein